jgi:hypothetical protein
MKISHLINDRGLFFILHFDIYRFHLKLVKPNDEAEYAD